MCMNMNRQHWCIQHGGGGGGGGRRRGEGEGIVSVVYSARGWEWGWGGKNGCPSGVFSMGVGGV